MAESTNLQNGWFSGWGINIGSETPPAQRVTNHARAKRNYCCANKNRAKMGLLSHLHTPQCDASRVENDNTALSQTPNH